MSFQLAGVVLLETCLEPVVPSCLALQDVRSKGLQFGRPVRRGHRRPQEELREPHGQPLVDPFVQGCATLRDEVLQGRGLDDGVATRSTTAAGKGPRLYVRLTPKCSGSMVRPAAAAAASTRSAFLRGLAGRDEAGDPPIAQASGPTQRPWYLTTQPHFERLLHGCRGEAGVTQLIAWAIVVHDFATPQATQQGESPPPGARRARLC